MGIGNCIRLADGRNELGPLAGNEDRCRFLGTCAS